MTIFSQIYLSGVLVSMFLAFLLLKTKFKSENLDPLQTLAFLVVVGLFSWIFILNLVDDLFSFCLKNKNL